MIFKFLLMLFVRRVMIFNDGDKKYKDCGAKYDAFNGNFRAPCLIRRENRLFSSFHLFSQPDFRGFVPTSCNNAFAVWRKYGGVNITCMPLECEQFPACPSIPDFGGLVVISGDNSPTVGRKRGRVDGACVRLKRHQVEMAEAVPTTPLKTPVLIVFRLFQQFVHTIRLTDFPRRRNKIHLGGIVQTTDRISRLPFLRDAMSGKFSVHVRSMRLIEAERGERPNERDNVLDERASLSDATGLRRRRFR